ncbi:MAG: carboxypeptidase-like regulatory domain-containing protein [Muribaculaceae bacterium]|nr:carboxypeptidase-like regulatory domain-containing protein [Muribaculaceae bacterium]
MKNRLITLLVSLLSCLWCAGEQVRFHGRVSDESGNALEFVTVKIAGTAKGTSTGKDGRYKLSCAKSDTLRIVFSYVGYQTVTRTFIKPEGDLAVNVKMKVEETNLEEVEVVDIRRQTSAMQSINARSVRFAPDASGGSIENMLATLAGVASSNELSSRYSVRGGSYDENSVYINGIEIYRPMLVNSGTQEGLSAINPSMVGAVGFSTGGFTARYADKMSSVLDITYRQPEAFEGSAGVSAMGAHATIGQASKAFSQLHGVRYRRNSSLLGSTDTKGEYDPDFFDYQTCMSLKPARRWKVSLLGNVALNNYRFTPRDRVTSFGTHTDAKQFKVYFDGHEKDRFETAFGAISVDYASSASTSLSLLGSAFLTNELVTYDITGEYWLDEAGTSGSDGVGGQLGVGRYHEHARNRLKASVMSISLNGTARVGINTLGYGLTVNRETLMDRGREWELRDSAGFSLPSDAPGLEMIYGISSHNDLTSTRMSAYFQDDIRLRSKSGIWWINGGLRLSHWSFNGETLVSPRFNVAFIPESALAWTFRLAGGVYHQAPFYREMRRPVADADGNDVIVLNDEIKSPRSIQAIAGADLTFRALGRPFRFGTEIYYKALHDLIPYEVDNLKLVYAGVNGSSGYVAGVDFKLFGQFVPGSDSWLSFSLMKSNEKLNGVDVPRPNDRRYSIGLYFTDYFPRLPRLKFSLRGVLSDGLPVTPTHSTRDKGYFRTPPYKRVDIGFNYSLWSAARANRGIRNVWIGLEVFNLLGISNVSSYYWVTDVNNVRYAVPNYLTRRQLNCSVTVDF